MENKVFILALVDPHERKTAFPDDILRIFSVIPAQAGIQTTIHKRETQFPACVPTPERRKSKLSTDRQACRHVYRDL